MRRFAPLLLLLPACGGVEPAVVGAPVVDGASNDAGPLADEVVDARPVDQEQRIARTLTDLAAKKLAQGDAQGALGLADDAARRDPRSGAAWLVAAQAAEQAGAPKEEIALRYERAIAAAPDDATAWRRAALFAESSGDTASARARYERAVALAPNDVDALVRLGQLDAAAGDPRAAAGRFAAALAADPSSVAARLGLAEAAEASGDLRTAEAALVEQAKRFPDVALYKQRLIAFYKRTGRDEDAARVAAQLQREDPKQKRRLRPLRSKKR